MSFFTLSKRLSLLGLLLCFCLFSAQAQRFNASIERYLGEHASSWKLTDSDVRSWRISDEYTDSKSGLSFAYVQQQVAGLDVYNAVNSVTLKDGAVVYGANRFIPNAAAKINATQATISAEMAVRAAALHLQLDTEEALRTIVADPVAQRWTFAPGQLAQRDIVAELLFVPFRNEVRLAWNVKIAPKNSADRWNIRIDAVNAQFLEKNNWTLYCSFGEGPEACEVAGHAHHRNGEHPENAADATYNVFPFPAEAPTFSMRELLTNPHSPAASPFAWHDTDGVDGAEYTITRGNNVYVYEDRSDANQPGYSPDGGAALNFDFPINLNQSPESNQDAILTNLFYVNNMLHDILHHHGFDEAAGNFQEKNYSNLGEGGDYVLAEGQDGGGSNNANFATPDDGENGRMQMYLWPSGVPSLMTVNTPSSIAGVYTALEAAFGPDLSTPVTAEAVLVNDDVDPVTNGCEPIVNAAALAGKIAVLDRGDCTFSVKITAVQDAGAIAAIVINNSNGSLLAMSGNGTINIPSVMISKVDGELLKAQINAGQIVNVTLSQDGTAPADKDGSLDNGIISHEYGHGVSNRLTGGPSNSGCLGNEEQAGEGWSDWLALILTIEPDDKGTDSRGIGTYALGEATNGDGIRRFPYSTDMSVNPQTYGDIGQSAVPHGVGEIWCGAIWDMTWKLIDAEGFDPDWYNGTGGNHTAMKLVLTGMKMQPCGPGFLDGRDAILAADQMLYNGAHRCLIWEAFARRGMGANAQQGSPNQIGDEVENFDLPTFCQTAVVPPTAAFTVDKPESCYGVFKFTDASTNIPQNWSWDFGDGSSSSAINPSHTYTVPGVYTVVLTVSNTLGTSTFTQTVNFSKDPAPVVDTPAAICAGESAVLNAQVLPGNTANWIANGTVVYTGTTFNTGALSATANFQVEQLLNKPAQKVGPANNSFGTGGNHNTGFTGQLLFEAYAPFRLISAQVYAQGAGNRTFVLYDASENPIQEVTVNVPNGASRVTLNLDVPGPGFYSVGNQSQNLYRNNSGASYPYSIDNLVRIYSSNATTNPAIYYYYLYDWEVQENTCTSLPATVTVTVKDNAAANFSVQANLLNVNFTDESSNNPDSWLWNFGDGSAPSTLQNPVHTYAAAGTYTITLTCTKGDCSSSVQKTITVTAVSGVNPGQDAFQLQVFPNPANDQVSVKWNRPLSGEPFVQLTDASGKIVLSQFSVSGQQLLLQTAHLPAGMYELKVVADEGSVTRKLSVVR